MPIEKVVEAVLKTDSTLTDKQRRDALAAMTKAISGESVEDETKTQAVTRWADAAKCLGCCTLRVRQLAHKGKLDPVSFTGGRSVGVTTKSLKAFLNASVNSGATYAAKATA